jgi:hypothetical protein
MKTVFFTIASDSHYQGCRTDEFIKSFKKFHPDIDLVVFRQAEIDQVFAANPLANFQNAKATFAKTLYNDYDLVVNIDADHLVFDRLTEILEGDYDIAATANFNEYMNCGLSIDSFCSNGRTAKLTLVPWEKYLSAGVVASPKKEFWDLYESVSLKYSMDLLLRENDVLNLLAHLLPFKVKVLDGDYCYDSPDFKCFYGSAIFGQELQCIVQDNKIVLHGKQMKLYHFAKGGSEKPHPVQIFPLKVCEFIYNQILECDTVPKPTTTVTLMTRSAQELEEKIKEYFTDYHPDIFDTVVEHRYVNGIFHCARINRLAKLKSSL